MEALFPTNWLGLPKPSIAKLFKALGYFVDTISKMASLQIADEWNEQGQAIHYQKLLPEDFTTAATTLTDSFVAFLSKLYQSFTVDSADAIEEIIDELADGDTMDLMQSLAYFADSICKMATMQIPIAWDENGKAIEYLSLVSDNGGGSIFSKAAT